MLYGIIYNSSIHYKKDIVLVTETVHFQTESYDTIIKLFHAACHTCEELKDVELNIHIVECDNNNGITWKIACSRFE